MVSQPFLSIHSNVPLWQYMRSAQQVYNRCDFFLSRFCEISRIESDPYILSNGALFGTLSTKVYKIGEKQQNDSPETFSYQLNVTSRHSAVKLEELVLDVVYLRVSELV